MQDRPYRSQSVSNMQRIVSKLLISNCSLSCLRLCFLQKDYKLWGISFGRLLSHVNCRAVLLMKFLNIRVIAGLCVFAYVMMASLTSGILDASFSTAQAQTISSIEVTGNQRIGRETILTYVTIEPGRRAAPIEIDESLKALFATGLFKDVSITTSGSILLVVVVENPIVNGIALLGNKKVKDDDLDGILLTKAREVFSKETVAEDVERIKQAYQSTGRFNVAVESKIEPLDNNRVNVVFRVQENSKTGIAKINFVGNNAFGDGRLKNAIATRESGLLAFLQSNDIVDQTRLEADEEQLRRFYFNHGYADFEVLSSVIDIDEEKNRFFITITINEGERYRFGKIELDSVLLDIDPEEFRPLISTKEGDIYDASKVEETIEALSLAASSKGFAFAEVRPRGEQTGDQRINITYGIDQGPRVFVERINVLGNTRTREFVIRREFEIAEGDAFNQALLAGAERRIRNLGIFRSVKVERAEGSAPDRIVLNVIVQEQPTGNLSFGAGADFSGSFTTNVSLTERNFLGRGQFVRVAVALGAANQSYNLSFTEPYFLGRRISAGFDVFRRDSDDDNSRSFDVTTQGGSLRLGFPITDKFRLGVNYVYESQTIDDIQEDAPDTIIAQGEGEEITSQIGYTLLYNSLDSNLNPTSGIRAQFTQGFAGLGGDVSFLRTEARFAAFHEFNANHEIIGLIRARAGNIFGVGEDVRVLDNFFAGGDIVRGFEPRGIGPRDDNDDDDTGTDALGGLNVLAATAEVQFPFPFIPRSIGVKGAFFADAGTLFGIEDSVALNLEPGSDDLSIRTSVGFGVEWASPFGPLRADFAIALTEEGFDETQFFRIGGGTRF